MKLNKVKILFLVLIAIGTMHFVLPYFFKGRLLNQKPFSQQFYDRNGILLRLTLAGDEKFRIQNDLSQTDPHLIQALLNKEDRYFYWHLGFNPISLVRAAHTTYIDEGSRQGASTITMQVSRLLYPESTKSILGKVNQIIQAAKIELLYSKSEILEAYLNWAPYGSNIEGIGAACFFYFNKNCYSLSEDEIQYLIQIPQNPQKFVKEANEKKRKNIFRSPHFVDYILQSGQEYKVIKTTLDFSLNQEVQTIADKYFTTQKKYGLKNYSIIIVDSTNNEVISYLGSADYFNKDIKGQIDANRSLKSPGSTLKPFIYALGLQQGLIHEKSLLKDVRLSFAGINPENFDEKFLGPLSADQALILSRNLPAADLALKLHEPTLYEFLNGKSSMKFRNEEYYGLSLALGGVEFSMQDLVKLYSALAQQGKYTDLKFFQNQKTTHREKILTPESAYIVLQMLKKNPRIENSVLQDLTEHNERLPVAWKTGTSKSYKDAWTIGVMGNYVVGVWFGDNDKEINPALVGRDMAAPLFFQIYDLIKNSKKYSKNQNQPLWMSRLGLNLNATTVCSVSKKIKTEHCGHHAETSLFIPGTSPVEVCQIHRKVYVDPQNQKMSCSPFKNAKEKIVEVWPDDLLEIYQSAGIRKASISNKQFSCDQIADISQSLVIASPQNSIDYLIYSGKHYRTQIQLRAISESDSQYLDWFVDKKYVGRANKNESLFFEATHPGRYEVSVTDNLGRSHFSQFTVRVQEETF